MRRHVVPYFIFTLSSLPHSCRIFQTEGGRAGGSTFVIGCVLPYAAQRNINKKGQYSQNRFMMAPPVYRLAVRSGPTLTQYDGNRMIHLGQFSANLHIARRIPLMTQMARAVLGATGDSATNTPRAKAAIKHVTETSMRL